MRVLVCTCLLFLVAPNVHADEQQLGQDCDQVERILITLSNAKYSRDWGVFQGNDGESVYGGCVMVVTGNRSSSPDFQARLDLLYPAQDNEFGKSGWELEDSSEDDQDFTITRNGNFCQVTGDWDASAKPGSKSGASSTFTIRVECGVREE